MYKEKDRKAGSQSFMWVMRSAADEVFSTDTCHLSRPVDEIMPQRVNSETGNLIHKIGTIFPGVKPIYFIRVIGNVNVSITICCQC